MRSARPAKANPPLIVDANGVLLHAIALQLLQPIRRRLPQVFEFLRRIDDDESPEGAIPHIGRDLPYSGAGLARPEIRSSGVREAVNHASMKVAALPLPGKGVFTPSVNTRTSLPWEGNRMTPQCPENHRRGSCGITVAVVQHAAEACATDDLPSRGRASSSATPVRRAVSSRRPSRLDGRITMVSFWTGARHESGRRNAVHSGRS